MRPVSTSNLNKQLRRRCGVGVAPEWQRGTGQWQDTKNMRNMMAGRPVRAKHLGLAKNGE